METSENNLSFNELMGIYVYGNKSEETLKKIQTIFPTEKEILYVDKEMLKLLDGVNEAKSERLMAGITLIRQLSCDSSKLSEQLIHEPKDVVQYFSHLLEDAEQEEIHVILLNTKNKVITHKLLTVGILNSSQCHPREAFKWAIRYNAAAIILLHNHPSGDPDPSTNDIEVTTRIKSAGEIIGIQLLDHLILGTHGSYVSLKERNCLA